MKANAGLTRKRRDALSNAQEGEPLGDVQAERQRQGDVKKRSPRAAVISRTKAKLGLSVQRQGGARTKLLSEKAAALEESLRDIVAQAQARAGQPHSPFDSSTGFVKRRVYALVREFRKHLPLKLTLAELGDYPARASALTENRFHWVLTALHKRGLKGSSSERRRIANELEYARRHDVPNEYVVGFLLQTGAGTDLYRRVEDPNCREIGIPITPYLQEKLNKQ